MKLVVSVLALAAACTSIASARPFPAGRVLAPPANVRVKPNSYIIEFHDGAMGTPVDQILGLANVVVDQHFNGLFNGISVRVGDSVRPEHLAEMHGVKRVYPNRVHTLAAQAGAKNITSSYLHTMTGAAAAWGEMGLSGKGISIGIIDTGVDYMHPDLGGCWKEPNCPWQKGADLVGDDYSFYDHDPIIKPNPTPLVHCEGHGTHVAGILMARGELVRGVAPDATYGMYRIFGCPKNGASVTTSDEFIIKAMLAAHRDGHDIISMSLGSMAWDDSPTAALASKLVAQGVVRRVGGELGDHRDWINVATALSTRMIPMWGTEKPAHAFVFDAATPIVAVVDTKGSPLACAPVSQDLTGKIALVHRGECEFAVKEAVVQEAGAVGILIVNNDEALVYPTAPDSIKIGVAVIRKQDGEFIAAGLGQGPVTTALPSHLYNTFKSDIGGQMSTFSSYGPSPQLGMGPLLSAPGGNMSSAGLESNAKRPKKGHF
ncbi:hypothetical protein H4R21_003183 [Coemansia helicoidea]|uniref:Uncharacterized protein n=1 Tax=Coemansia helicoidea TaxID=1286919 RepID=A0ACC1L441_9FUNG|nr:hypothetical protein H4R21_003183 [Coemansia helicoidea]